MEAQPQYEDHQGMIIKILGWQAAEEGEGAFPFVQALKTHDPAKGAFSTWLFHNLLLHKRGKFSKNNSPHPNQFIEIDSLEINGAPQTQQIAEFRDNIRNLSIDAQTVVACIFRNIDGNISKRTKWPTPSALSAKQIRGELKLYCRETLSWKWKRYWDAIHEIENLFRENRK